MIDLSKRRLFARNTVPDRSARLPWLANRADFTDMCTRCGQCIEACETQIITIGDGRFPEIDFSRGECTFCYQCADACPESLFLPKAETPWQAKAVIADSCLAKQNVECRSCGEMCATMAIKFRPEIGTVAQPSITLNECNGCGACVSVCPASSISVSNITAE
ncbi:ferredoxin-type protein NapF [Vibrio sp. CAU 1672]|uniref:ferredoxin-type protein NapF n=1 Tax=Vibrio sp. CAU 1672 TaxID=3032594 RepID=UPI0023DB42F1|nr:ferredoxin-type protein NapF [Vibrio sp. CAU 1672]MDF2155314.1 ferredoxin-type protein NapF [Vibrio sp. CAU 1672]